MSIEVWDTGTGIPETELGAIFREYHQLKNHTAKGSKGLGLGLGLAIVQHLADLLYSPIRVRSRVGRGSVFALEVPIAQKPRAGPPSTEHPVFPTQRIPCVEESRNILVVEDDDEVRDALKSLFNRRGYSTIVASNGAQALNIASGGAGGLDLIIADYNLPGMNGLEVIARIEEVTSQKVPAIFLTGDISTSTSREIANRGHLHLYKPVAPKVLIRHINAILDNGRRDHFTQTVTVADDNRKVHSRFLDHPPRSRPARYNCHSVHRGRRTRNPRGPP